MTAGSRLRPSRVAARGRAVWRRAGDTRPDDTDTDTVPADTVPADTVPADTVPADTVPADTVPDVPAPHADGVDGVDDGARGADRRDGAERRSGTERRGAATQRIVGRERRSGTDRRRGERRWARPSVLSSAGLRGSVRWLAAQWSRSLQLRVAATTLLVTGVVVFVLGVFLVNQVSAGILRTKRSAALSQADAGANRVTQALDSVSPGDGPGVATVLSSVSTSSDPSSSSSLFFTSIKSEDRQVALSLGEQPFVPETLQAQVAQGVQAIQYAQVTVPGTNRRTTALIVGEPVSSPTGSVELYYAFPLDAEKQTIALVQRTVLLAGLGVMVLVAAIAVLVTRQVVQPVRVAARTAGRLAAGDLSQRIAVRSDDDLAQLGRSFNDMAASLQRQIRRLEDLGRLQRRFTSDVSHELRTPLTTVRMAAEILHGRREEFPADIARSVELLHDELDRFENLLSDLLEISRYDAGVARLEVDTVDVRGIVDRVVDSTEPLARTKGMRVSVASPATPVTAEVDARRIERIVRNLLANAIDHSEQNPVEVRLSNDGEAFVLSVRDYGVGLRPGEAGLVFNRFWRGDPSRSRLTGGTGLGLAISLEDARLHGGFLQAWGERGRGALFRLTVPLTEGGELPYAPMPSTEAEAQAADEPDGWAAP